MDRDKRKKRNKRKKKKQNKAPESSGGERDTDYSSSCSSVNLNALGKGHDPLQGQAPDEDVHDNVSEQNADLGHHSHLPPSGRHEPVAFETEKQRLLQREAILEETIKHLQHENHSLVQKEATLEKMTKKLQNEVYSHEQKQDSLETELVELQSEKDSWMEKEASLKTELVELRAEKDSMIEKENTTKETISSLNDVITGLKVQVEDLEESRKSFAQENQRLVESISDMQLRIQNLEGSIASVRSSNEVYAGLGRPTATASGTRNYLKVKTAEIGTVSNPNPVSASPVSGKKPDSSEDGIFGSENSADVQNAWAYPNTPEADELGQIQVDDNGIVGLYMPDAGKSNESGDALPLSDAPLIGAPFRLMSFVARYVSGDDLVNTDISNADNIIRSTVFTD